MSRACVDCNYTFTTGDEGQAILTPAFEFIRMTRLTDLPFVGPVADEHLLTWPTVAEDVNETAAGCGQAVVRASDSAFRVTEPGWFHVGAGLLGENGTNASMEHDPPINYMAGLYIELDRGGATSVMVGDIQDRWSNQPHTYNCSIERRLEDEDILRCYYLLNPTGNLMANFVLPASSRNQFSIRLIRRA